MRFELSALPYSQDALEPYISRRTVHFHYDKHHKGYVDKLNAALEDRRALADKSLEQLVKELDGDAFNAAAQTWNHDFYWQCIGPNGGIQPAGQLAKQIKEDFGSLNQLKRALAEAAVSEFGSGWAWLTVGGDGVLRVLSTTDAETPLKSESTALLTIDVWEHAYYLDYQHERGKYIEAYLDHLVQWDFASETYLKWSAAAESAAEVS